MRNLLTIWFVLVAGCSNTVTDDRDNNTADQVDTQGHSVWSAADFDKARKYVQTDYGRVAFVESGTGPAAIFLHGFPLNGFHWRHQLAELSDLRRCIAIDLMGLGHTETGVDQDLSFSAQAEMVIAVSNRLGIEQFDLVGNDTGGGIAQLIAAKNPGRVRSLVLTNSDTHDNYPPKALSVVHDAAVGGVLDDLFVSFLNNPGSARSGLGSTVFEDPEYLTDELLKVYLEPITATSGRRNQVNRYISSQDNAEMVTIEPQLRQFRAPTLIVWGTADPFFDIEWAHWLRDTVPGVTQVVELTGAKLFFTEERGPVFSSLLREHWMRSEEGVFEKSS